MTLRQFEKILAEKMPGWKIASDNTTILVNDSGKLKIVKDANTMKAIVRNGQIVDLDR